MKELRRKTLRQFIRWAQRALLVTAAITLGYCTFVLIDAWFFQRQATQALNISGRFPGTRGPDVVAMGGLVGRLEIPRLGVSVMVAEGTSDFILSKAAGHIEGTTFPGRSGNVGIAGHRDTLFRPLRNIHPDDVITLTTVQGRYQYRVVSTRVVSPSEIAVLDSDGNDVLTLVTCHPFYFIGPAPNRFIVRAERVVSSNEQERKASS